MRGNFLKERLEELKLKLEESEKALVAYAEKKELIGDVKGNGKEGTNPWRIPIWPL